MSKSYKLKDDNYIDSSGIVHNRQLLSNLLNAKWKTATLNTQYFDKGRVRYIELGNIVILNVNEVHSIQDTDFNNETTILASGLPTGVDSGITLLNQGDGKDNQSPVRMRILNGNLYLHWTSSKSLAYGGISGTIIACVS